MRSKTPFLILKYDTNGDGGFTYLTNNGKWLETSTVGDCANQFKFWHNSGNAWNAIAKLVKAKKATFEDLFVWSQNELSPFTQNDADNFARILNVTTDIGELDAISIEAQENKSKQIDILDETLTEIRTVQLFPNYEGD